MGIRFIYTSSVEVRCARLSNLGVVSTDDLLPSFPVNGPLVSSVLDSIPAISSLSGVDNSTGLRVIEDRPGDMRRGRCAADGAWT